MTNQERQDSSANRLRSYSADEIKAKYPLISDFEKVYGTVALKKAVNKASASAYIGNTFAPRLQDTSMAYGEAKTKNWLQMLLLNTFGLYETDEQQDAVIIMMVDIIFERFAYERVTVLIFFLGQCLAGEYKTKYRQLEIQPILESATAFFNALPKLKEIARAESVNPSDGERKIHTYSYSYYDSVRSRNLWYAWRDGTLRLWRENGVKAIKDSLLNDDEYSCGIQGLIYIGALWLDNKGNQHFNNNNFEKYTDRLDFDPEGYRPKLEQYKSL